MSNGLLEIKKDKRLLVLFAFGLSLLLFDLVVFPLRQQVGVGRITGVASSIKAGDSILLVEKKDLSPRQSFFLNRPMAINRASAQDLSLLPGIGDQMAEQIVAYRDSTGQIRNRADLEEISGIGRKISRKIGIYVTFAEP